MGEVWRATDAKLGRDVALKVLPDEFVSDIERLARFEREARLLASLRHPNIATIHGIEHADGVRFLVMALAEGEDLAARLARGPLAVPEAIDIAVAIADALEVAHEKGVIHRDLKPANLRVTPDGHVTILDFGLGKSLDGEESADLSNSPTMARAATQTGVILGTAAYMSPEQARGRRVDRRADIWAFGVILWEMLTGRRLFEGETVSDTLASVLKVDVDLAAVPAETPPSARWVLQRCLQRDPRQRLRDIGEARVVLSGPPDLSLPALTTARSTSRSPFLIAAVIAALLLVGAAATVALVGTRTPDPALRKLDMAAVLVGIWYAAPSISPDGQAVVFPVERGLAVRRLDDVNVTLVAEAHDVTFACWAPDSRQIAFISRGRLWRVSRDGRQPVAIATLPKHVAGAGGMAWLPDDRIVIAGSHLVGVLEVSARGGTTREVVPLSKPAERDFHDVTALPDGRGLLITVHRADESTNRIDIVANDRRHTVLTLGKGDDISKAIYSPTGHVVFQKGTASPELWAVPFSMSELRATGEPFLIGSGSLPSVADDGTLAYVRGSRLARRQLLRVDRAGRVEAEIGRPAQESVDADVAPDGRRVVAAVMDANRSDLALFDSETRTMTPLTAGTGVEWQPDWSPDGRQIVFGVGTRDSFATVDATSGKITLLGSGATPRWWPDGQSIIATVIGEDGSFDIVRYTVRSKSSEPLIAGAANQHSAEVSRDGRFVAYLSDETGRDEVFIREMDGDRRTIQVSSQGSVSSPRWAPGGDEVYFRTVEAMYAAARLGGERVAFADPQPLFSFRDRGIDHRDRSFDVTPDGKSFIVTRDVTDDASRGVLTIVSNWTAEFSKR